AVVSTTITGSGAPIATITNSVSSCTGNSNGVATASVTNGTSPYTYLWSNGRTVASNTGLSTGVYTVTVTDNIGCTAVVSTTITGSGAPIATITNSVSSCTGNSNGVATASITNGTAPYTYLWSNGATASSNTGLSTGVYSLTVTDNRGCTTVATTTITGSGAPVATITNSVSSCNGNSNGVATASITNGTAPYTYSWSNGNTTAVNGGLGIGSYSLTVTDNRGCTTSAVTTITASGAPIASISSLTNVSCFGGNTGSAQVSVTNGTTPYTYLWSTAATTNSITNQAAGNYTVTITDANACTTQTVVTITQPASAVSATITTVPSICTSNTGSASITASGGVGSYTYLWNTLQTTAAISGIPSGTYNATITDANGCTYTASTSITNTSGGVASVNIISNVNCFGDSTGGVNAFISGGLAPYDYLWNTSSTSQVLMGIPSGVYSVTITDANGCKSVASANITQPSAPLAVTYTVSVAGCMGTSNAVIATSATGGTASYSYNWSNGSTDQNNSGLSIGSYSLTVIDSKGCAVAIPVITVTASGGPIVATTVTNVSCNGGSNGSVTTSVSNGVMPINYAWSNGSTNSTINLIPAGIYTVTVTDFNGCTSVDTATVTEPSTLSSIVSVSSGLTCAGSSNAVLTATTSGGTPIYTYTLFPTNTINTSGVFSNLAANTYTLVVSDANGCTAIATSSTSAIVINPPTPITLTVTSSTNVSCNGTSTGSVVAIAGGGVGTYTYAISPGSSSNTTGIFNSLAAGTYTITAIDTNGCNSPNGAIITITQTAAIVINSSSGIVNESCPGTLDGSAAITVTGGNGGFTYTLQPLGNSNSTGIFTGLSAGSYTIAVTDNMGCSSTNTFTITNQSTGIVVAVNDYDSTEFNTPKSFNVFANDNASGGNTNITVLINPVNGSITGIANGLIDYNPNTGFSGNDSLTYIICDPFCVNTCDTAKLYIEVLPEVILSIPNGFSPDGDGINDNWVIKNLLRFGNGNNKVEIFNRWGNKVYEANPYQNNWDGTPNTAMTIGDGKVVPGTYYYVLIIEGMDPFKGYLEIRR
ncbi:MAG: gliding motility-associated C-terminal domain-containing protein, partial [Bacteroidetes bacterium]|nr:gliding motility-associated C-terminal domain-containing protein [Bacteroidota bacterium]